MNRSDIIHQKFLERLKAADFPTLDDTETPLANEDLVAIFESQLSSRLLDIISRRLSANKQSFYTIGSAGHEGNAVLGHVFRVNDPAFLHYRSCAFMLQRSRKLSGSTPLYDSLLAFTASRDDPIAGGRHKVIGSKALWIPPQTSTIASHLPKAMGAAHALGLYKHLDHRPCGLDDDSIVVCSFGDASINHSSAQGALNAAAWAAYQQSPMPIVFVCEDNGIGISTPTPRNWIEANFAHKPGFNYIAADGLSIVDSYRAAREAERYCRRTRKPVFLHLRTVRLMAHAGSDIEASYHSLKDIADAEQRDPLIYSAALMVKKGLLSAREIAALYTRLEQRIMRVANIAVNRPKLQSRDEVMESIWPPAITRTIKPVDSARRAAVFEKEQRHLNKPLHMAKHINLALADIMLSHSNSVLCGEDIGKKGGVYGVTQGLLDKFGAKRVTNTLLDEQSILGLAIGLSQCGFLAIPEIQYLAYVHNAEDQIRGEAATLSFFSSAQFTNPMVIRIAGFAYQKGFGGHFHNDNSFAVFRDIPGIIVATPSCGADAAQLLRTCIELAVREQKIVVFIEPIALYMTTDLHQAGDQGWASLYQPPGESLAIRYGDIRRVGEGKQLCILSYANGFYLSVKAARQLKEKYNIQCQVVDLRWLHPLPETALLEAVKDSEHVLIVDECRKTGSVSEAIITLLHEQQCPAKIARNTAEDCFIPLGAAANLVLPSVESIVESALTLCQQHEQTRMASL